MPYPLIHGSTMHNIYMSSNPLGVECSGCGHRGLTFKDPETYKDDMKKLHSIRFQCSACGSYDWKGWLFRTGEVEAWLEAERNP